METLRKPLSFLPDETSSSKKTISTMLQFVGLLLQRIQTLHSLDRKLKIQSGINNLISDKLEHSKEVSQSYTLMLLETVTFFYNTESNELPG